MKGEARCGEGRQPQRALLLWAAGHFGPHKLWGRAFRRGNWAWCVWGLKVCLRGVENVKEERLEVESEGM